ncbi:hypothetical protein B0A54_08716 [Friedmanniomyces endolithicus]|uniref:Uncharacterized protein n=1 Tax=Friedmanniomyces endolithicus TaxID=329885 RepID=A0A4U0UTC8_9PEZI|nr:hypothetical protein B0A54_08716 [Friedmanniomyces endolithicus]
MTPLALALLPQRQKPQQPRPNPSPTSTTPAPRQRPPFKRSSPSTTSSSSTSSSSTSSGWYDTTHNPTLDDIAARLNTTLSRFEQWQSRCAQNVVMGLLGPTPVVLFVLNPVALAVWGVLLGWWWMGAG